MDANLQYSSFDIGQNHRLVAYTGADPRFLERGFISITVLGFALLILSHFSLISHENEIIWSTRPNYFIFIGYLKSGKGEGVRANTLNPLCIRQCYSGTLRRRQVKQGQNMGLVVDLFSVQSKSPHSQTSFQLS